MTRAGALVATVVVMTGRAGVAAPMLSADQPVDAPVSAPTLLDQQTPAIAFGGGQYLAVWRDGSLTDNTWTILGARLGLDGTVLDDPPIAVANNIGAYRNPAVAFDGQRFLAVWDSDLSAQGLGIHGAYIAADGTVATRFSIDSATNQQVSVAGGDGFALVTWQDAPATFDTHASLFNSAGMAIKTDFAVSNTNVDTGDGNPPAAGPIAAWGGTVANNFLVVWNEGNSPGRRIVGATVEVDGSVSNGGPFVLNTSADATEQTVARVGNGYFAGWVDFRDGVGVISLYGRSVSSQAVLGSEFRVAMPTMPSAFERPQAVGVDGNALVVWEAFDQPTDGYFLFGARVSPDGLTLPDGNGARLSSAPPAVPPLLPQLTDSRRSALASDGTHALAVWQHASTGVTGYDVLTLPIDPAPATLAAHDSLLLGRGANYEVAHSLATDGNVFLLVWEDDRGAASTGVDILGLRIGLDGQAVDSAPFVVCNAPGDQFSPVAAAAPGGDFLVVWADARGADVDLYGTRIGATGTPRDGNGLVVSQAANAQLAPTVTAGDSGWLVAWEDWRNVTENNPGIWATTVSTMGVAGAAVSLVDPPDVVHQACAPVATWNGKHFFVAYEQPCYQLSALHYTVTVPSADLFGQWLSPAGQPSGAPVAIAGLAGAESAPGVAATGDQVALVWRDQTGGDFVRAALLADVGTALTKVVTVAGGPGDRDAPAVTAANGTMFVSWIESSPAGVLALRLGADLAPLDAPIAVASTGTLRADLITLGPALNGAGAAATLRSTPPAAVAAAPTGEAVVAYDLLESLTGKSVSRVHHRKLALLPRGVTCKGAGGCADGICTGGVCCDTPCDGVCQACGKNGCVETPPSDARCGPDGGVLSCAEFSTTCRTFQDQALGVCIRFGECAAASLAECSQFTDAPDGTACLTEACTGGTCSAGACQCGDGGLPTFPLRQLPVAQAAAGCAVAGGGGPGGWWLLGLLLVLARALIRPARPARSLLNWYSRSP